MTFSFFVYNHVKNLKCDVVVLFEYNNSALRICVLKNIWKKNIENEAHIALTRAINLHPTFHLTVYNTRNDIFRYISLTHFKPVIVTSSSWCCFLWRLMRWGTADRCVLLAFCYVRCAIHLTDCSIWYDVLWDIRLE